TAMAKLLPARLKVILGENTIEKLLLPNGIPESLDDLHSQIKTPSGLQATIRLQYMDKVNAEFQRLMAVPLEERFMAQLDLHSSQLIRVIRAKGGATHQKTADIMETLDQAYPYHQKRP
ncbi:hypothetical protein NFI96_028601, partial [Prochilodus magdalenae]